MNIIIRYFFINILLSVLTYSVNAQSINDLFLSLESTDLPDAKLSIYKQIAYTYQKEQAYAKSSEYLQKAYKLESNVDEKIAIQEKIGRNELALKQYDQALVAFQEAFQISEKQKKLQRNILAIMVNIAHQQGNYKNAINYNETLLNLDRLKMQQILPKH